MASMCSTTPAFTPHSPPSSRDLPSRSINTAAIGATQLPPAGPHMDCRPQSKYEAAVQRLNLLQSNAATLQKAKDRRDQMQSLNVPETLDCLNRAGIQVSTLNSLNIVHVTGTKGKGSTCAYVETILRTLGLKTGFFSSPHMIHVRERIRINGRPMEEEAFADAFDSLYHTLKQNPASSSELPPMPAYFKFLTLLAFDVFLKEKVDVAIMEVGIGGEFDCTNVIQSPVICGISTLDFDHTALLGNTLKEIAWNKAGIFKKGACGFVSEVGDDDVLEVIRQRAHEKEASISVCPPLSSYTLPGGLASLKTGISGEHQKTNVSLALQMTREWLRRRRPDLETTVFADIAWSPGQPFPISPVLVDALARCNWPGRSQMLEAMGCRFFLDGAHTVKSVQSCAEWYKGASGLCPSSTAEGGERVVAIDGHGIPQKTRVLIFHCTGDRSPDTLLSILSDLPFTHVFLTPPAVVARLPATSDAANFFRPHDEQTRQSVECESAWANLRPDMAERAGGEERIRRFECISHALEAVHSLRLNDTRQVDVLVTGSLILVGGVLSALDFKQ